MQISWFVVCPPDPESRRYDDLIHLGDTDGVPPGRGDTISVHDERNGALTQVTYYVVTLRTETDEASGLRIPLTRQIAEVRLKLREHKPRAGARKG